LDVVHFVFLFLPTSSIPCLDSREKGVLGRENDALRQELGGLGSDKMEAPTGGKVIDYGLRLMLLERRLRRRIIWC